jgi:hypothetical protein
MQQTDEAEGQHIYIDAMLLLLFCHAACKDGVTAVISKVHLSCVGNMKRGCCETASDIVRLL